MATKSKSVKNLRKGTVVRLHGNAAKPLGGTKGDSFRVVKSSLFTKRAPVFQNVRTGKVQSVQRSLRVYVA